MPQEFRDPIHGLIELDDDELHIVNHPAFQRLRRIKQLALASYLYPGAVHTRFEHSLGVFAIAKKIANHLNLEKDQKTIVKTAALIHDIGHGPFSHVSENPLKKFSGDTSEFSENDEEIHELISRRIIEFSESLLPDKLSPLRNEIIKLLTGSIDYVSIYEIITGPYDADKQDYLLRDSYYCGVQYGIFDNDRLIHEMVSKGDSIMIRDEGIHVLEQFFLAKYYITNQVYKHRVRLITDKMLERAIELGISKYNIPFLKKIYKYEEGDDYIANYLNWHDDKLLNELSYYGDTTAGKIAIMLKERRLFKIIYRNKKPRKDLAQIFRDDKEFIQSLTSYSDSIEEEISRQISLQKELVILNIYSLKSIRDPKEKQREILIFTKDGEDPSRFEDESNLFKSIMRSEQLSDIYIEVYAPIDINISRQARLEKYRDQIRDIIAPYVSQAIGNKAIENF